MGPVDVLFNNAGILGGTVAALDELDAARFEHVWRVNCGTAFEVRAHTFPPLRAAAAPLLVTLFRPNTEPSILVCRVLLVIAAH